jgi:hypothetical protein
MRSPKIVVYTAITKGYDTLKPPLALWQEEAQFVVFMEEPQSTSGWKVRQLYRRFKDPCRNAKIHKLLPHVYFPDAEYSLWVDGCIVLKSKMTLTEMIDKYLRRHDIALCQNPRNCVYQEAAFCLKFNLDEPQLIHRQVQRYFDQGYPQNNGLVKCGFMLRRHTRKLIRHHEAWYEEIKRGSRRDQISFNYTAYKTGLKYAHLPGTIYDNPHFQWTTHAGQRFIPGGLNHHFPSESQRIGGVDEASGQLALV